MQKAFAGIGFTAVKASAVANDSHKRCFIGFFSGNYDRISKK